MMADRTNLARIEGADLIWTKGNAFAVLVFLSASSGLSLADCFLCDEAITVNSQTAQCYFDNFDDYVARLKKDEMPFIQVELSECAGVKPPRRGMITIPGTPKKELGATRAQADFQTSYLLDEASLFCLRDLLKGYGKPLDPKVEFNLKQACKK